MAEKETKTCQNCKNQFAIEPEDFEFYARIKVPPPTFCPECRTQRRFSWRNERTFHRVKCASSGKSLVSGFYPDSGFNVYDRKIWWSDCWDPLSFGTEFDFSKSFFDQFNQLFHNAPHPNVFNARTVNCEYVQHTGNFKNGYLVFASWGGEDVAYAARVHESKDSMDVFAVANCEFCYEAVGASKSYQTFFSQNIENCNNSFFLYECKGCSFCFGCTNLRNKSYYIFNEPHSKEEYLRKVKEFNLGSYRGLNDARKKFLDLKLKAIRKFANINNSKNVIGDNIYNASDCIYCFDVTNDVRDSKFIQNSLQLKDSYDGYGTGAFSELLYEVFDTGVQGSRLCLGAIIYGGMNVYYSYNCHGCNNLFGCVGLRNKSCCILNKQYSKEEYENLVPRIIEHMNSMPYVDKKGRVYKYGEFFSTELSPFAYNETIAQEYFPLTKEQALEQGYSWRDPETRDIKITVKAEDLPDHIKDVKDDILNQIIGCQHEGKCNEQCTLGFKIIPQELEFYRKMNLALPRLCPNCRHYQRLKQRNPLKLWHRKCTCAGQKDDEGIYQNTAKHFHDNNHCTNEFETSYAPERLEIVYCEQCYNSEVV